MPTYAYACDACGKPHEEFRFKYDDAPKACPNCSATEPAFHQSFMGSSPVCLVRGSPTTLGQQAEANARRLGSDRMEELHQQEKERVGGFTGRLPEGARPITGTGETPPWRDGSYGNRPMDKPLDLSQVKNVKKYIEKGETT